MNSVLALIDGSVYAPSVCDHAAWAATRLSAPVDLVHALGRRPGGGTPTDFTGSLDVDVRDTLLNKLADLDASGRTSGRSPTIMRRPGALKAVRHPVSIHGPMRPPTPMSSPSMAPTAGPWSSIMSLSAATKGDPAAMNGR